ncbi:unnamed protein product [Peniophora sp. CBMAI 1063]|nr:unnamed protein product [Peniophora sp. CBMAI 1063]
MAKGSLIATSNSPTYSPGQAIRNRGALPLRISELPSHLFLTELSGLEWARVHTPPLKWPSTYMVMASSLMRIRAAWCYFTWNLGLEAYHFAHMPTSLEEHIRYRSLNWSRLDHRGLDASSEGRQILTLLKHLLHDAPASRLTIESALNSKWVQSAPMVLLRDLKASRTQPGLPPSERITRAWIDAEEAWERGLDAAAYTSYDAHDGGEQSFTVPNIGSGPDRRGARVDPPAMPVSVCPSVKTKIQLKPNPIKKTLSERSLAPATSAVAAPHLDAPHIDTPPLDTPLPDAAAPSPQGQMQSPPLRRSSRLKAKTDERRT